MVTRTGPADSRRAALRSLRVLANTCGVPARAPGLLDREPLVKRLLDADDHAVVVVCAPAGYGKTTTVLLWCDADPRPSAWVHLDALDDNPVHLLRHVAAAVDEVHPLDPEVLRTLSAAGRAPDTELIPALARALESCPALVLVFDDVHRITTEESRRALDGVIAVTPRGSQVALLGRTVPALHLARRRLAGEVVDLGADDLVFDPGEAAVLLRHAGLVLDDEEVDRLVERTEGWPAGLYLAALALRRPDPDAKAADFSGRSGIVVDYLVEELLAGLDPAAEEFLMRSAVLDRMSARLLDEVLGTSDSARRLSDFERSANLFLVPLDPEREWYRYHHLLAEMLRDRLRRLEPDEARRLEARASDVLERHGDVDGAIRHAIAAGDDSRAADLALGQARDLVERGAFRLLGQWVALLPPGSVERSPSAAIASAWFFGVTGDLDRLRGALSAAERMPDGPMADGTPSLGVAVAGLRMLAGLDGCEGVLRDSRTAREGGGPDVNPWWLTATVMEGAATWMLGDLRSARSVLEVGLAQSGGRPVMEALALSHLALLDVYDGDVESAYRRSSQALGIMRRENLEGVTMGTLVFAVGALVAARNGRTDEEARASIVARHLLARLGPISPRTALAGYLALGWAAVAAGVRPKAVAMSREAEAAQRRDPSAVFLNGQLDELRDALTRTGDSEVAYYQPLTSAELRVLAYLPTHLSIKEIAERIIVSRNTVKTQCVSIYRKLGASSRSDAVAAARRIGLLADGSAWSQDPDDEPTAPRRRP